jgi:hypothetical protein
MLYLSSPDRRDQGQEQSQKGKSKRNSFLVKILKFFPLLRIRDPCLLDLWIRDPEWVENQHPDPGFKDEQPGTYFLEFRNHFLGLNT